jgi:hypothetical protein
MGAKGTTGQDARVALARKVLDETTHGHDDYGHAVGQLLELRAALAGVLSYVDEQAGR